MRPSPLTHSARRTIGVCVAVLLLAGAIVLVGDAGSTAHELSAVRSRLTHSAPRATPARFAVGEFLLHLVDPSRRVHFPGQRPQPRPLLTEIRYPATAQPPANGGLARTPATAAGPFPLIVFAHGFDATPDIYARLLDAWVRAGYVVAAPIFPLTNAHAPGGADESDLPNQPRDLSFVITQMLARSRAAQGPLSGLIDPTRIAVAGQSDGGVTALASAFDTRYRDTRIGAAVILSGAEVLPGRYFQDPGPPLLASQGTADVTNLPENTYAYFHAAHAPKFLLRLIGAGHRPPYTVQQPQLGVVERVTVAFLDAFLTDRPGSRTRLWKAGQVRGVATLSTRR